MLRIVLVEPREAGNVGAAARVMKNFGHRDLWIVGEHPELHPLADWWASGADDVVESARFADSLHHAVKDAKLTVATTSSRGRTTPARSLLRAFDPESEPGAEVPDPYAGDHDGFELVLDLCERACRGLLAHVRTQL